MSLSDGGRRNKGDEGEAEVEALFAERGFVQSFGGALSSRGGPGTTLGFHIETRRQERLRVPQWVNESARAAPEGFVPLVCYRRDDEPWMAVLPLESLLDLLTIE